MKIASVQRRRKESAMLIMKYLGLKTEYVVNFSRVSENIVQLIEDMPAKEKGFTLSRKEKEAAWDSIWCGTCNDNTWHDGMKITYSSCGQATDYQVLNCGRHANNSNYYSTSTHTYTGTGYICGYNEGDIEKATIVIKK